MNSFENLLNTIPQIQYFPEHNPKGGHPDDIWIKKWNDRGYAAIAMDTTGFFPTKSAPHLYEDFSDGLQRKLVNTSNSPCKTA